MTRPLWVLLCGRGFGLGALRNAARSGPTTKETNYMRFRHITRFVMAATVLAGAGLGCAPSYNDQPPDMGKIDSHDAGLQCKDVRQAADRAAPRLERRADRRRRDHRGRRHRRLGVVIGDRVRRRLTALGAPGQIGDLLLVGRGFHRPGVAVSWVVGSDAAGVR